MGSNGAKWFQKQNSELNTVHAPGGQISVVTPTLPFDTFRCYPVEAEVEVKDIGYLEAVDDILYIYARKKVQRKSSTVTFAVPPTTTSLSPEEPTSSIRFPSQMT